MNENLIIILSLTVYKIVTIGTGLCFAYMGYKLFVYGVFQDAGELKTNFKNLSLVLKKAAPGTFFAVLGTIIVCVSLWKGINYLPKENARFGASGAVGSAKPSSSTPITAYNKADVIDDVGFLNNIQNALLLNIQEQDWKSMIEDLDQRLVLDLIDRTKLNLLLFCWQDEWGDQNEFRNWANNEPGYFYSDPPAEVMVPARLFKGQSP